MVTGRIVVGKPSCDSFTEILEFLSQKILWILKPSEEVGVVTKGVKMKSKANS